METAPQSSDIRADLLNILAALTRPAKSLQDYQERLLTHADEYLRIGAFAALLRFGILPRAHWDSAVALSVNYAVARPALLFFQKGGEYDHCDRVIAAAASADFPLPLEQMRAELDLDARALAMFDVRQFRADGDFNHLLSTSENLERTSGWREALPWAARAAALFPNEHVAAWSLLTLLENANQFGLIEDVLEVFRRGDVFSIVRRVFRGSLLIQQGKPHEAVDLLKTITPESLPLPNLHERYFDVLARATEKTGDFKEAAALYRRRNSSEIGGKIDPDGFLKGVRRIAAIDYGELPPDLHPDYCMLVGFPRSGTTLLENALAAHPAIETFEEIPSYQRTCTRLEELAAAKFDDADARRSAFEEARGRYYVEIDRRKRKTGARIFVDKLPIRSAYAESLIRLFPTKRYIFSIRHPYDVVLSCYRQMFGRNTAMENFRDFNRSCALYDQVMSIWFAVFSATDDRVLYTRYNDVVLNFQAELTRVLQFLGAGWDQSVLRFAELSEQRKVATPSYAKVRAGLTIGVQSSWRNYRFLFETRAAAVLDKWVDRFGYDRGGVQ